MQTKVKCSGESNKYGGISKRGPNIIRKLLVQSAWATLNSKNPNIFQEKYLRLSKTRGKRVAIVAVAAYMLRICKSLFKNKTIYNYNSAEIDNHKELLQKLKKYKLINK